MNRKAIRRSLLFVFLLHWAVTRAEDLSLSDFGDQPLIKVQATGHVFVAPDVAILQFGAEARAKTAKLAREKVASAAQGIMAALAARGVAENQIESHQLALNPVYAPDGAGRITGYQAQHQISAKVIDLTQVGDVIDETLAAAGDAGRMYGLRFAVQDSAVAETGARSSAYAQALAKAQALAAAAGIKLGTPIRIIEMPSSGGYPVSGGVMARMAADSATPIASGEQDVAVTVEVVFNVMEAAATPP